LETDFNEVWRILALNPRTEGIDQQKLGTRVNEGVMLASSKQALDFRRSLAAIWRTLSRDFSDPYRPELHYMRGPGPKWREKHGEAEAAVGVELAPLTEITA
jgi:hypothetical protein